MRLRPPRPWALLALVVAGCSTPAASQGANDARRDVEAGRPTLAFIGNPNPDQGTLDARTGLLRRSLGCCVTKPLLAYQIAYNGEIRRAYDEGSLDPWLLSCKVTSRAALRERFASQGGGVPIPPEGMDAPGGRFVLDVGPRSEADPSPTVFVTDRPSGLRRPLYWHDPRDRALFDHEGTTLLLRDEARRRHVTFDLPLCVDLEMFPDDPPSD